MIHKKPIDAAKIRWKEIIRGNGWKVPFRISWSILSSIFILWLPFILCDSMQQALKVIVQRSDCVDFKGITYYLQRKKVERMKNVVLLVNLLLLPTCSLNEFNWSEFFLSHPITVVKSTCSLRMKEQQNSNNKKFHWKLCMCIQARGEKEEEISWRNEMKELNCSIESGQQTEQRTNGNERSNRNQILILLCYIGHWAGWFFVNETATLWSDKVSEIGSKWNLIVCSWWMVNRWIGPATFFLTIWLPSLWFLFFFCPFSRENFFSSHLFKSIFKGSFGYYYLEHQMHQILDTTKKVHHVIH